MQKTFILTYDEYYNHMSNLKPQMKYPKSLKKKGGVWGGRETNVHTHTHTMLHTSLNACFVCTLCKRTSYAHM